MKEEPHATLEMWTPSIDAFVKEHGLNMPWVIRSVMEYVIDQMSKIIAVIPEA